MPCRKFCCSGGCWYWCKRLLALPLKLLLLLLAHADARPHVEG